ncbi:glutamate--cysteine ligase [Nodosilinea sp. LEGE 07298]|uniref:glutamate--cysteine ligase n=1 Tax=Nodosilinea sp. LEGE 07298 TaxID=2777970 RepID=UPI0018824788|nr:glutamate--cysteine ligase [Nodosilinea sp. LEGE 07298]MBE9108486.1 glutamate--cysteine ligase [Nodosilinea sp. LEGE 07298]
MLLSKGFEIEMYTGTPAGEIVGLSDRIVADLNGFVREPDSRNVEYTTPPLCQYEKLLCELVRPRHELRRYLKGLGNYTLIPGSTLALGPTDRFYRSDPHNPYHSYIEQTYGTTVVTASVHINIGLSDPEILMRACRLVRVEAPLYLALTASSPFLGGQVTGSHSSRWQVFPKTPELVPLFTSHAHHIQWMEDQLAAGTMQNVRHLWSAVRPNGDRRPYNLNRLELRICDLISDPVALLAVTTLLEARLIQLIQNPGLDPLTMSKFPESSRNGDLVALTDANEAAVARHSLDAELRHWQDGRPILARQWVQQLYDEVWPIAKANGISCFLSPVKKILREGNEAQRWLRQHGSGQSVAQVVQEAIAEVATTEAILAQDLCEPCAA